MLLAVLLLAAISRAELIERFKAPVITVCNGLVQVCADCPADMRKAYQMPIADFVKGVCNSLYASLSMQAKRFDRPGIVVYVGDVRTNVTDVVTKTKRRDDGARYTLIYLPAPGYADVARARLETAKAFFRAVRGEEVDDETAKRAVRRADPRLKADDQYADIARWMNGETGGEDDERYLKLARSVLEPGRAREEDVLRFASRLYLYPSTYALPFGGRYTGCSFRDAVTLAAADPLVRLAAYGKITNIVAYGGGRGEKMSTAAAAFAEFLAELARYEKPADELLKMLDAAEAKLKGVLEE